MSAGELIVLAAFLLGVLVGIAIAMAVLAHSDGPPFPPDPPSPW